MISTLGPLRERCESRKGAARGFTLVELLVAVSVFIIFLLLLTGVVSSVSALSSQASSRLEAVRLGREVFQVMAQDLEQIPRTATARRADTPLQFLVNPPSTMVPETFQNPISAFWQSSIARDRSSGNLAIVGYFVERPPNSLPQLRRVLIEPSEAAHYFLYSTDEPWLSPTLVSNFSTSVSNGDGLTHDRGWVADGVLALWVRCLDQNGNIISRNGAGEQVGWTFDSQAGFRSGQGENEIIRSGVSAAPAFVDIGLVLVPTRDLPRLDSIPMPVAGVPANMEETIADYVQAVEQANPGVQSVTSLVRRFPLGGSP